MAIFRKLASRRPGAISEDYGYEVPAAARGSVFEEFFAERPGLPTSAKKSLREKSRAVLSPRYRNARPARSRVTRKWRSGGR